MEKQKITDGIYQYIFPMGDRNPQNALNITVLINKNKALIIDTGYKQHSKKVLEDLRNQGITVEYVIASHYHTDHIGGAPVFVESPFMVSEYYQENIENCKAWAPDMELREPDLIIADNQELAFEGFDIKFNHTPGHSVCSITTIINGSILQVGDLVMADLNGKIIIPYICVGGTFDEHIISLEEILSIEPEILLLSHGNPIIGNQEIKEQVQDRIYYLKNVLNSQGTLTLEQSLKEDLSKYTFLKLHEKNLEVL